MLERKINDCDWKNNKNWKIMLFCKKSGKSSAEAGNKQAFNAK